MYFQNEADVIGISFIALNINPIQEMQMKKRMFAIWFFVGITCGYPLNACLAQSFDVQLLANQSALDGEFNAMIDLPESMLTTGIGGVYKDDHYRYLNAGLAVGNELITEGLSGELGIFGNIGRVFRADHKATLASAGFAISASFDFAKGIQEDVPLMLMTRISLSPSPLCFQDTDKFAEIIAEISWMALKQAAVVARYRYLDADFERKDAKWQKTDNAGYLGLRFIF